MSDSGVTKLLFALMCSLVFSAVLISYLLLSIYGISVAGINIDTGINSYSRTQNFETCNFNKTTWFAVESGDYQGWKPECGIGLVYHPSNMGDSVVWNYVWLKNEKSDGNGNIENNYYINNSVHGSYVIILRYTNSGNQNVIIVDNKGFHIPNFILNGVFYINYLYDYPYPDANLIEDVTIKTIYNEKDTSVDFYFNDEKLFTATNLKGSTNFLENNIYYGGVGTKTEGFTLKSFDTVNQIVTDDSSSILATVIGFIATLLKILLWNVDEAYMPMIINCILIKTQLAGIILCIIVIAWK